MKEVGFVNSGMPEEFRVALLPKDVERIENPQKLFFQTGYGAHINLSDNDYRDAGANVESKLEAYGHDILCIPKPWIDDVAFFQDGQTLMGWLYLSEKKDVARAVLEHRMTGIAWEDTYSDNSNGGKCDYLFEKNRWFAGYIAANQALPFARASPENLEIGVLGRGRIAQGVFDKLKEAGAEYEFVGRDGFDDFLSKIRNFDVVFNCWYYDPACGNYLTIDDLQDMKSGSLFVDVCSDGVEGSVPHPPTAPFYHLGRFGQILIYNNPHTPSVWPLESSEAISKALTPFLDMVMKGEPKKGKLNEMLERATHVYEGQIIDKRIKTLLRV
ncbi:hypothetical protein HQ533_04700 [Candidatus Woesearchaeota archaeon]|nr:hypothetical protein [Candidatus Woesearchaeota archaeon]